MRRNRAVSTTVSYTLTLAISSILVVGLLTAATGYVDERRQEVVRDQLRIIGEQVVSELSRVNQLVAAGQADQNCGTCVTAANSTQQFPERVAGSQYRLTLNSTRLVVESTDPDIVVRLAVPANPSRPDSTVGGGPVKIWWDSSSDALRLYDG